MNDGMASPPTQGSDSSKHYRVLARKYRPVDFSGLIGQEAMVRTLANAIAQGRLAHGFMLTGVRGVGKTTTARILARCFNCVGLDGKGRETAEPCGQCEHCKAISEDRHVDVIEMDAASRTGIDDIRELIEGVRYRPVTARYKVYIVDEIHMLSEKAFNALLKTLEEPPPHVKFVFATTEIRKVPVTVLSRCQRFDLRRVGEDELARYFSTIAEREGVGISSGAVRLIARAADGSVRDGLSLLDQAITLAPDAGSGTMVEEAAVRDMLGLADRTRMIDLYQAVLEANSAGALDHLSDLYQSGADPVFIVQDMLDLTHWLTRVKISPSDLQDPAVPEAERQWATAVAGQLSLPVLARFWQMLLKGLGEIQQAPQPLAAAEMVLIRLIHAAQMPDPADLVRRLSGEAPKSEPAGRARKPSRSSSSEPSASLSAVSTTGQSQSRQGPSAIAVKPLEQEVVGRPQPQSFLEVVELFRQHREGILTAHLQTDVHLVGFERGRIEFRPGSKAPANLANRVAARLAELTGERWLVSVSSEIGEPTMKEQAANLQADLKARAANHPLVKAVIAAFPGTTIEGVRDLTEVALANNPPLQSESSEAASEDEPT